MIRHERSACPAHVDDSYLIQLIQYEIDELGEDAEPCSFCDDAESGAPIDVLADAIRNTIERYYTTANDAGVPWDEGEYVFPVLDTSDVLSDLDAGLDWPVYEAVLELLEDEAWVPAHDPAPSPSQRLRRGWNRFREHVEHTSRFLLAPPDDNSEYEPVPDYSPADLLTEIGKTIVALDLVTTIPEASPLYRSRTFDDQLPFRHAHQLAAPPPRRAAQGRMNAAGISVFYAALDLATAAAEVYDGKDHVATATFVPTRNLVVVDLTRVPRLSVFNPSVDPEDAERAAFLHGFVREITRPITRDDRVHHEYTPTQLFTEYLRWRLPGLPQPLDGIVYPSARTDGRNIVVFAGPAGCLADDELPEGVERRENEAQLLKILSPVLDIRAYGPPVTLAPRTQPLIPPSA